MALSRHSPSNETLRNSWKILFPLKCIHIYGNVTFIWEIFFLPVPLKTWSDLDQIWTHAASYQKDMKRERMKGLSFSPI